MQKKSENGKQFLRRDAMYLSYGFQGAKENEQEGLKASAHFYGGVEFLWWGARKLFL